MSEGISIGHLADRIDYLSGQIALLASCIAHMSDLKDEKSIKALAIQLAPKPIKRQFTTATPSQGVEELFGKMTSLAQQLSIVRSAGGSKGETQP